jgi:hypothetical protein
LESPELCSETWRSMDAFRAYAKQAGKLIWTPYEYE